MTIQLININTPNVQTKNNTLPRTARLKPIANDSVSFSGRLGTENIAQIIGNADRKLLVQETAFFRQMAHLEFLKEYLAKTFAGKEKIRIFDGACSSGEETWTLRMLFNDFKNKVDITGFDLGKDAVDKAKSGKYLMTNMIDKNTDSVYEGMFDAYKDAYLMFDKDGLTDSQMLYKKIFGEFFEPAEGTVPKAPKPSFARKIGMYINSKIAKLITGHDIKPPEYEYKFCQVKDSVKDSCNFVQGDIMKLDEIIEPGSADAILFRNALYHLISEEGPLGHKIPKPDNEVAPLMMELFKGINKALAKDGVFVLGEHNLEYYVPSVYKSLELNGFEPILENGFAKSVWKKV